MSFAAVARGLFDTVVPVQATGLHVAVLTDSVVSKTFPAQLTCGTLPSFTASNLWARPHPALVRLYLI